MLKSFEPSEIRMARGGGRHGGRHGRCSNELVASDKQGETISPKMPHDYPRPVSPALVSNDNIQIIRRTCSRCGGKHKGSCSVEETIRQLSAGLTQSFQGTSRWSISDTTAGLLKLYKRHTLNPPEETVRGIPVHNELEIVKMLHWLYWSIAAYAQDKESFVEILKTKAALQIQVCNIVQLVPKAGIRQPSYFIAVDHASRSVVMGIRGTFSISDVLTDMNPQNEPFLQGHAHSGMLASAKWLLGIEGPRLTKLLEVNRDYNLVLTGHSLGAATAALLKMLICSTKVGFIFTTTCLKIDASKVFCYGYGSAPCVDRNLVDSLKSSTNIINVVLQDDIVPRITPAAVEALRNEIQETEWSHGIKGVKAKKVVETIEQVNVGHVIKNGTKVGASVFQKFQRQCVESEAGPSDSTGKNHCKIFPPRLLLDTTPNNGHERSDADVAAEAIVTVATGSSINMHELERCRLFVPGLLYHIRRYKIKKEDRVMVPARPGDEISKFRHTISKGTDMASQFNRIILSSTVLSDHSCYKYEEGLLDALKILRHKSS